MKVSRFYWFTPTSSIKRGTSGDREVSSFLLLDYGCFLWSPDHTGHQSLHTLIHEPPNRYWIFSAISIIYALGTSNRLI